jgi:exodeoxyribonuclease VII large subunit
MSGRLPFDPSRVRGASKAEAAKEADAPLTVSQLASSIDAALRSGLPAKVRVRGEVSGFRDRTHWYFDLKDGSAVVNAVMFASAARRAPVRIENGVEVVATGRVEFYAPGGKVSLIVDRVEPVGRGALEAKLKALIEELRGLGWLDEERKRALPVFPRAVAVITSRTGAALQDVIDTARRRCCAVGLVVVDARVQGEGAAPEVAGAIRWVNEHRAELGVDAILVTRGGGSMEDLWAFNERIVAEAIVKSALPVVAAIGHETDTTVAELVADCRCATPTQAAMRLTPDREALERQLDSLWRRAGARVRERLSGEARRVQALGTRPVLADPVRIVTIQRGQLDGLGRRVRSAAGVRVAAASRRVGDLAVRLERARPTSVQARRAARVDELAARLRRVGRRAVAGRTRELPEMARDLAASGRRLIALEDERLAGLERELRAVGPQAVLARGFSVTTGPDGRAVRSVGDVAAGERVRTRVADGAFESVVGDGERVSSGEKVSDSSAPPPPPTPRRRSRRGGSKGPDANQMDLFGAGG